MSINIKKLATITILRENTAYQRMQRLSQVITYKHKSKIVPSDMGKVISKDTKEEREVCGGKNLIQ